MNLGGLGLYLKVKKLLMPKYDPNTYWYKLGEKYTSSDVFANPHKLKMKMLRVIALLKLLETLQFNSVLEYSCGFGFITKFILDKFKVDDYVAFDASPHWIYEAKVLCKNHSIDFQTSMIEDFKTDKKFDLVLGVSVLHHIRPNNIKPIIKKLLGYTKKDFIHDDQPFVPNHKIERTTSNFWYDYKQIYQELGYDVKIITIPHHPTRVLYHVKVN